MKAKFRQLNVYYYQKISQLETTTKLTPSDLNVTHLPLLILLSKMWQFWTNCVCSSSKMMACLAVSSFPIRSSSGPNDIRSQHIIELFGSADIKPTLLMAITAFFNLFFKVSVLLKTCRIIRRQSDCSYKKKLEACTSYRCWILLEALLQPFY